MSNHTVRMDAYVHNHNYPISKLFNKKVNAVEYIKRALKLYPYVRIILYSYSKSGTRLKKEKWKMVRNKRGGLSPRKVN